MTTYMRTALTQLSEVVRLSALLVLAATLVALLVNPDPAAATPAPLPAEPRSGDLIALTAHDCALIGLTSAGNGACRVDEEGYTFDVVAIAAPDDGQPEHPAVTLLLEQGFGGEAGDAISAIYVPTEWAVEDEAGIWIVTAWGLARCEHSALRSCSGFELYT